MSAPADEPRREQSAGTVWERLRACLEQWQTVEQQHADSAARTHKLAQRAEMFRSPPAPPGAAETVLLALLFHKGGHRYGIPLEQVLEVQALERFSVVPGAPAYIQGVIPWRGLMLALVDLDRLFQSHTAGLTDVHVCVIVEAAGRRLGLLATDIIEIQPVALAALKTVPELEGSWHPDWVRGICAGDCLLLQLSEIMLYLEHGE